MIFKYSERDSKELKEIMYVIVVDFSHPSYSLRRLETSILLRLGGKGRNSSLKKGGETRVGDFSQPLQRAKTTPQEGVNRVIKWPYIIVARPENPH